MWHVKIYRNQNTMIHSILIHLFINLELYYLESRRKKDFKTFEIDVKKYD